MTDHIIEYLQWVSRLLQRQYNMTAETTVKIIKNSGIVQIACNNPDMFLHDPIEQWVEALYQYYLHN